MSAPLLKIGDNLSVVLWWTFAKLSYKLFRHLTWVAGLYLWPPEPALPRQMLAVSRAAHASCYWPAACCAAGCWPGGTLGGSSSHVADSPRISQPRGRFHPHQPTRSHLLLSASVVALGLWGGCCPQRRDRSPIAPDALVY